MKRGILYGVSVGPGDPELLTLRAVRAIAEADVVAVPKAGHVRQTAARIAGDLLKGKVVMDCSTPMSHDRRAALAAYRDIAQRICSLLDEGKDVAFLTLGDASVYSTYGYVHELVRERGYDACVIPGVPSFCAAAARLGMPLCEGSERLLVVPASDDGLDEVLDVPATKVFMKAGRSLGALRDALVRRGVADTASMVANCGMDEERVFPHLTDADVDAGYFSLVIAKQPPAGRGEYPVRSCGGVGEYVTVGAKRMRCGYTTGTCAAAATRAAAELLVNGVDVPAVSVHTPAGIDVVIEVEQHEAGPGWARCAVRKDAGDDPDVTDGVLVFACVAWADEPGIHIDGGVGIGRVTRAGLDQPVGEAAINSVPRRMIREQVERVLSAGRPSRGVVVTISIPEGVELAKKTFNPRLGIEGGISVIGTSGIVKPMSEEAMASSIELEMRTIAARGIRDLLVVPGNYGRDFACDVLKLRGDEAVQCSNYFGATIDAASLLGFERMLVVGHLGKMAKVAAGIMNTHSRVADCRLETLAAHAALAGAPAAAVRQVMAAATTDAAYDALVEVGLAGATMDSLMAALADRLSQRAAGRLQVEAIVFSNAHGLLGKTPGADALMRYWSDGKEGGHD